MGPQVKLPLRRPCQFQMSLKRAQKPFLSWRKLKEEASVLVFRYRNWLPLYEYLAEFMPASREPPVDNLIEH
jgi:hypothetical protein